MGSSTSSRDADIGVVEALVAVVVFAWCAWGAAPLPHLLDSAELAAASFGLGIAHPPGEPTALLVGRLFTLAPLGSVAFRVSLSQAAATAIAAAFVARITRGWLDEALGTRGLAPVARAGLAAGAGVGFACAPGVVVNAVRPEVYGLATALALAALHLAWLARSRADARLALGAAFVMGIGLGNHPLVAGATGLGAVVAAWPLLARAPDGRSRIRLLLGAVLALVAGALVITYVPVRAFALAGASPDVLAWGDARSLEGLRWVLAAETFAHKSSVVHTAAEPSALPFMLIEEVGLAVALLALAGAWAAVRLRLVAALPFTVAGVGAIAAALVAGLDPQNPDIRGYLGVAIACLPALAALGLGALVVALPRAARSSVVAIVVGVHVVVVAAAGTRSFRDDAVVADHATGALLDALPPGAAFLSGHFETAFVASYQRAVEGRRPDVAWAHMGFARGPGYAARVSRACPELGPAFVSHAAGPLSLAAAMAVDAQRPLAVEPGVDLDDALAARLVPGEGAWTLRPSPAEGRSREPVARNREERSFLAFRAYRAAELACRGRHPEAPALVARLRSRLPDDALVASVAQRCAR